jgi:hypothetical protein
LMRLMPDESLCFLLLSGVPQLIQPRVVSRP